MTVDIDWSKSNPANVQLALDEHEKQLLAGRELFGVLDNKARWILTVMLPLATLVAGFEFSNSAANVCSGVGAGVLGVFFLVASWLAAVATMTRHYRVGATIPKGSIEDWKPLIEGGEAEAALFAKMRIATLAEALAVNDESNDAKARYIRRAIIVGCLAAPVAALFFLACHIFLLVAVPSTVCPAII